MKRSDDRALERYQAYENESLEKVILHLKQGRLKAGAYMELLKLKKGGKKS